MLAKNPCLLDRSIVNAAFSKNARSAWRSIIQLGAPTRFRKILLPCYIGQTDREGSGIFDPVKELGCDFDFYQLRPDFSADLNDLKSRISKDVSILLLVHYFGFCRSDLTEIKNLCDMYDVTLVEDCAHLFTLSTQPESPGSFGRYSFYSVHKYLATASGGIMRSNNPDEKLNLSPELSAHPSVVDHIARSDLNQIRFTRRRNFEEYRVRLERQSGIKILFGLERYDNPQSFPISVMNGMREKLYFHLMERNVPTTALYYRLIEEIKKDAFPRSHEMSESILNLPLHQDILDFEVSKVCEEIAKFMDEN